MSEILVAIITSSIAACVSIGSAIYAKKNQQQLTNLEHDLEIQKTSIDKKIDYQYIAKQRIYEQCSPLMFQLIDLSETALFKISDIVYHAGKNNLISENKRFADRDYNFFKASTFYKLLAPMACIRLLREKLTTFDLNLDPAMNVQYMIAKNLYYSFSVDRAIAKQLGNAEYEQLIEGKKYPLRQGIWGPEIDTLAEFLIVRNEKDGNSRIKRWPEFDQDFKKWKSSDFDPISNPNTPNAELEILEEVFFNFDIVNKPILWRILIDQARLYLALVLHLEEKLIKNYPEDVELNFVGRQTEERTSETLKSLLRLIETADETHLRKYLDWEKMKITSTSFRDYDEESLYIRPLNQVKTLLKSRFETFTLKFDPKQPLLRITK